MVIFNVESDVFNKKAKEILRLTGDLRPVWIQIAREFYKSNKAIFKLQGPGRFIDFQGPKIANTWKDPGYPGRRIRDGNLTAYQWQKQKEYGFPKGYPLLKATGRLEKSITVPGSDDAIKILSKESLRIGTNVPYSEYHQYGTKNIPMRPFLFIDPTTTGEGALSRRAQSWARAMDRYFEKYMNVVGQA